MLFDKEMKYEKGARVVLNNGKTVEILQVDGRHGEYHVFNIDDEEDFEIIKESDIVVAF